MVDKQISQNPRPPLTSDLRPPWLDVADRRRRLTSDPTALRSSDNQEQITDNCSKAGGFTLVELVVVTLIIAILMVLVAPAFTNLKGAGDITDAAYTIKGILDQARTYAMANNTYTWVGFAGSIGSSVTGNVSISVIASTDGTKLSSDSTTSSPFVIGTGVGTAAQIGKLIQLQNSHIGDTGVPTNDGTEFESRPAVNSAYRISTAGNSLHQFTVQQTTFKTWIQFSPRGEAIVNGGSTQTARYAEVGLLPTHGVALASTPNIVAIEVGGLEGGAKIYRR
jgi:prepilin-type N-terminal cleavage/methylation domain-containing protein